MYNFFGALNCSTSIYDSDFIDPAFIPDAIILSRSRDLFLALLFLEIINRRFRPLFRSFTRCPNLTSIVISTQTRVARARGKIVFFNKDCDAFKKGCFVMENGDKFTSSNLLLVSFAWERKARGCRLRSLSRTKTTFLNI